MPVSAIKMCVCVCYRVCFLLLCEENKNISPALDLRIGKEKSERENLSTLLPLSFTFLCVCFPEAHGAGVAVTSDSCYKTKPSQLLDDPKYYAKIMHLS